MTNVPHVETKMYPDSRETNETGSVEYAGAPYVNLMSEVDSLLPPNHKISYLPFAPEQKLLESRAVTYVETGKLPSIMALTDAIICISRDEDPNATYDETYPERNIQLTPSGASSVDKSVELFKLAVAEGNNDIKFIATGRMNNRAIRMMLALPVIADFIGINAEDVYHISEERFKNLLAVAFTPENIQNLFDHESQGIDAHMVALKALFNDSTYEVSVPSSTSTAKELKDAAAAVLKEYKAYPRISTSRLMVERATMQGVPLESIIEEDDVVDTVSNLVNVAVMLESVDELKNAHIKRVVIVAGSDHLPRTTWDADHILPNDMEIISVESDPRLDNADYAASCVRELNSLYQTVNWIGGTRDLGELDGIVEAGYFSPTRKDAAELANQVATSRLMGDATIKHA